MKRYFLLSVLFLASCKNSVEENCFYQDKRENFKSEEFKKINIEEILKATPKYIKISSNQNKIGYEDEMKKQNEKDSNEKNWEENQKKYEKKYSEFLKTFGEQFLFEQIQKEQNTTYGIGENQFGYWFLEVINNVPKAYFLGLSDFTYISKFQKEKFVKNNKLFLDGSLIRIRESWGLPYGPQMESVKNFQTFEIDLDVVKKDSDNDGFNDIFENLIHLNPNSKDTDNDGFSDFTDTNPLYKSEKSKFTDLYQEILDSNYANWKLLNLNYSFVGFHSDCEYLQKINPKNFKAIILPEKLFKRNDYHRNIFNSHFSKIRKSETNENTFYIYESDDSGTRDYTAEFVNGKWKITSQQSVTI